MALRLQCTKYGSEKPQRSKLENQCGAPQFDIPCSVLCYIEQNLKISEISKILFVSESTIYRKMKHYGLSKMEFLEISDNYLDNHVKDIFPHCGECLIKQMLFVRNIKVQRWRLRDSLHRVDSEGIAQRSTGRLQRRRIMFKVPTTCGILMPTTN